MQCLETCVLEGGRVELDDGREAGERRGAATADGGVGGVYVAEGGKVLLVKGLAEEGEKLVDGGEGGGVIGGVAHGGSSGGPR